MYHITLEIKVPPSHSGIPVILDYCAEGDITSPDLEGNLDQNADLFAASADCISKQKN